MAAGITRVGIPVTMLYLVNSTVRIESDVDNPEELVYRCRAGKLVTK